MIIFTIIVIQSQIWKMKYPKNGGVRKDNCGHSTCIKIFMMLNNNIICFFCKIAPPDAIMDQNYEIYELLWNGGILYYTNLFC